MRAPTAVEPHELDGVAKEAFSRHVSSQPFWVTAMPVSARHLRVALALSSVLVLATGCRDAAPPATDSALAQDIALAQRPGNGPAVFNDAPVGAPAPAAPAAARPTPRPEPPRASATRP